MSEPETAFMKLQITRSALVRWLHARPSPASRWTDWRGMGRKWFIGGRSQTLAESPPTALDEIVRHADIVAAAFADNRELLHHLVRQGSDAPEAHLAAFDTQERAFVAGSLVYAEGIEEFIAFLAMARSAADHLHPAGHGIAIVHNYLWGGPAEQVTTAALRMMPSGESRLLAESDRPAMVPAFQSIVDALMEGQLPQGFAFRDQLRLLR